MYFKQLLDERYGCASYVVASRQSHEAAIVDPSLDVEPYEALLHERDFQLRLDRATFLTTITSGVPARPLNMTAIEATNRGSYPHQFQRAWGC